MKLGLIEYNVHLQGCLYREKDLCFRSKKSTILHSMSFIYEYPIGEVGNESDYRSGSPSSISSYVHCYFKCRESVSLNP